MSTKLVKIEYLAVQESSAGRADEDEKKSTFEAGTVRRVDAASAKSLVEKGVAKLWEAPAEADAPEQDEAPETPAPTPPVSTGFSFSPSSGNSGGDGTGDTN